MARYGPHVTDTPNPGPARAPFTLHCACGRDFTHDVFAGLDHAATCPARAALPSRVLDGAAFDHVVDLIGSPPEPTPTLRRFMATTDVSTPDLTADVDARVAVALAHATRALGSREKAVGWLHNRPVSVIV